MRRLAALAALALVTSSYAVAGEPTPQVLIDIAIDDAIPVDGLQPAVRIDPPDPPAPWPTTPPAPPAGLWGAPFAPAGLSNCDEMSFYRQQWGLPAQFDQIGWRESNCRNEDGVHTSCCWGYWQLWVSYHLQDHRLVNKYHACGVWSHHDLNSDTPIEKQRQACAARSLYDVVGLSAW